MRFLQPTKIENSSSRKILVAFRFAKIPTIYSFWKTTSLDSKNIGKPLIFELKLLEKQCF